MSYLLRVQLPDRPGSLGALALALGSVGADILSLDVVDRGAGFAIDDLVVDVEPGKLPDTLITAAKHSTASRSTRSVPTRAFSTPIANSNSSIRCRQRAMTASRSSWTALPGSCV